MPSASRPALWLAFSVIYLVWGSTYLGIRIAVETIPPFTMAGLRFFCAGALLLGLLSLSQRLRPTWRQLRDCAVIGAFLLVGGNGLVSWAEQSVPSGIAALLVSLGPVFMVLAEWLWPGGSRPSLLTFVGLAAGLAGVTWLFAPWQDLTATERIDWAGALALLSACVFWSLGSIYSRRCRDLPKPLPAAALQMLTGGLLLLLVAWARGEPSQVVWAEVSTRSLIAFAYLVVIGAMVGYSTYAWLLEHSTPALVSTYAFVNPAVAVVLGSIVLAEPISPRLGLASLGIIASVVLITWARQRPAPTRA